MRYDELVELLGEEDASRVCEQRGGTVVYVPKSLTPGCNLVVSLGLRIATRIAERYSFGESVLIPMNSSSGVLKRRATIVDMLRSGRSRSEVAQAVGCHIRTVQRIRRKLDEAGGDADPSRGRHGAS